MNIDYILVFGLGLCIGSFLNVCIYRIPVGKSIVTPPSACPVCGKRLESQELIPILSYLFQRGRCRGCEAEISWRYPAIELFTGLVFLAIYWRYGYSIETLKLLTLSATLITIAFIDIDHQIIPNVIVFSATLIAMAFSYTDIFVSLLGLMIGFSIIALIIIISGGKMGWGDAKLLAMIGAFLGWQAVIYSLFVGSFFGSILGIGLIFTRKIERKTPIPFGPFLSLGALIWLFLPWWFR